MGKLISLLIALSTMALSACMELKDIPQETAAGISVVKSTESTNATENKQQEKKKMQTLKITAGDKEFTAELYKNDTAAAFAEMLPITHDMSELNGNEKYFYLDNSLPRNSAVPDKINEGDIMLYGSDCAVLFYETFDTSYSYTPIGHIEDTDDLKAALGNESVTVKFEIGKGV